MQSVSQRETENGSGEAGKYKLVQEHEDHLLSQLSTCSRSAEAHDVLVLCIGCYLKMHPILRVRGTSTG